jgi:hypothetical protein
MAKVTCAISGIVYTTTHLTNLTVPHTEGMVHPIFSMPRKTLYTIYTQHCKGELTQTDSYLLFLAFFHSSGQVSWKYPASLTPTDTATQILIETNFSSLLRVLEQSDLINHPAFEQPSFAVYYDNSSLNHLPNWIMAWEKNINYFYSNRASEDDLDKMQKLENKLSYHILSGEDPKKYAGVIANWACTVGEFPPNVAVLWKETIKDCFSIAKMFETPLALLKEIKEHIELNIEVGSIHFHTLYAVINEGIDKHKDYLGGSSLGYTILPTLDSIRDEPAQKGLAALAVTIANASKVAPVREDYPNSLAFLKARLAYKTAQLAAKEKRLLLLEVASKESEVSKEETIASILAEEESGMIEDSLEELESIANNADNYNNEDL